MSGRKITEDFIGTCQACFGEFKVNENSKQIVLHGYKRPGHGYIIGNCEGTDHAPFEYDTALTVRIIAGHRRASDDAAALHAKLMQGLILKLTRHYQEWDKETRRSVSKQEIVEPGHEYWEMTLRSAKIDAARREEWHHDYAEYLQKMVDAWERKPIVGIDLPATGKEKTPRAAYDPVEAKAMEERAKIKAARDAKPGKLSIIFYQPSEARPAEGFQGNDTEWRAWIERKEAKAKGFAAEIKEWATANIEGKKMVRPQIGDYDLPRDVRGTGDYDVVIVNLPWEYRDQITSMFSAATLHNNEPKKISYVLFGGPVDRP